ncbi:MAG: HlyD family secretion protein [Planctomycetota bacterium]
MSKAAFGRGDYDDYLKTRVPRTIASAKNSLRSSEFSLESAAEELKQLQQMYEEDELTEQSEEIVLRRAQRSVESSQHFLEGARITYKRTMETTVPREKESQQLRWQSTQRNHEKTMLDLRLAKRREQIEFERKVRSFEEKEASMDKMRSERDRVVLTADHDGVFLHGALLRGRLPTKSPEKSAGDSVSGTTVIGTLADPSSLRLIIDLAESNLAKIRVGQSTKISPNAAASVKVNGRVAQVGAIPYANGKHNVVIAINGKLPANILPTMSASAEIDLSEKKAGKQKNAAKAKAKPAAKAKAKSAGKKAK